MCSVWDNNIIIRSVYFSCEQNFAKSMECTDINISPWCVYFVKRHFDKISVTMATSLTNKRINEILF